MVSQVTEPVKMSYDDIERIINRNTDRLGIQDRVLQRNGSNESIQLK